MAKIWARPAFSNVSANPYNFILYTAIRQEGRDVGEYHHTNILSLRRGDIFHYHWPEFFINRRNVCVRLARMLAFAAIVLFVRMRGLKVVWTVHNLFPHDAYAEKSIFRYMTWFIGRCDGLIFLSHASVRQFFDFYRIEKPPRWAVIPHGDYRSFFAPPPPKAQARQALGLPQDKTILMFFGAIRPYKNVETLLSVFSGMERDDLFLVVAGKISPRMTHLEDIKRAARDNVRFFTDFIPNEDVPLYLSAADIVVLPYKDILNSGSALLALTFDRRVIVPALGSIQELQGDVGDEWVFSYEGELTAEVIESAVLHLSRSGLPARCPLEKYEARAVARQTIAFYDSLYDDGPPPASS